MLAPSQELSGECGIWARENVLSRYRHQEFETCPDWVPAVDGRRRTAAIILKTLGVDGFDHIDS